MPNFQVSECEWTLGSRNCNYVHSGCAEVVLPRGCGLHWLQVCTLKLHYQEDVAYIGLHNYKICMYTIIYLLWTLWNV